MKCHKTTSMSYQRAKCQSSQNSPQMPASSQPRNEPGANEVWPLSAHPTAPPGSDGEGRKEGIKLPLWGCKVQGCGARHTETQGAIAQNDDLSPGGKQWLFCGAAPARNLPAEWPLISVLLMPSPDEKLLCGLGGV